MTGVSTFIKIQIILQKRRDIFSARRVAMVFGEISPKIRISTVRIPVAIPAPALPKTCMARVVAREDAVRLTTLLPIRIALSIFAESSVILSTRAARLFPSSASDRIRMRFTVVSAVSDEEKKADRASRMTRMINCIAELMSKNNSPL